MSAFSHRVSQVIMAWENCKVECLEGAYQSQNAKCTARLMGSGGSRISVMGVRT